MKEKCNHENCKKKISFANKITCRCGKNFCIKHSLPECHNCEFNFKENKITLVKVVADKITNRI